MTTEDGVFRLEAAVVVLGEASQDREGTPEMT